MKEVTVKEKKLNEHKLVKGFVDGYIEIMGGEVWIESVEEEGSTFYFTIPKNESALQTVNV